MPEEAEIGFALVRFSQILFAKNYPVHKTTFCFSPCELRLKAKWKINFMTLSARERVRNVVTFGLERLH